MSQCIQIHKHVNGQTFIIPCLKQSHQNLAKNEQQLLKKVLRNFKYFQSLKFLYSQTSEVNMLCTIIVDV